MNGLSSGSEAAFADYVDSLVDVIGHADRAEPLNDYCLGLMLPVARKSVEPLAAVTAPARVSAKHQSLLHFVGQAPWSDEALLARVRELTLPAIERHGPITAWIVDDTGFLKQGRGDAPVGREPGPGARSGHWFRARLGDGASSVLGRVPESVFDPVLAAWRICGRRSGSE